MIGKAELTLQTQHGDLSTLTSCDLRKLVLFPALTGRNTFRNNNVHACAHVWRAFGHNRSQIWRTNVAYFALFQTVCSPLSSGPPSHAVDTSRWISVTLTKQTCDGNNRLQVQSDMIMVCVSVCVWADNDPGYGLSTSSSLTWVLEILE